MTDELVQISFKIPSSLKSELQRLADADRRKLSPYLAIKLEQIVQTEKAKSKKK
jgi:hypothetical protein